MPTDDPPSYEIELPTIASTQASSASPVHAQVPLDVEHAPLRSHASPANSVTVSSSLAPPDLVYPSRPTSASTLPLNGPSSAQMPTPREATDEIDPGLHEYLLAHDRGDAAVTRRLPEAELLSLRSGHGQPEPLPAYGENAPPVYTRGVGTLRKEPQTLARYLFKYGFFFPVFWIIGALLTVHPHSPLAKGAPWRPDDAFFAWYNQNVLTEEDKMEFAAKMQEIERKWANRCKMALALFMCLCLAVGITIFGLLKVGSKSSG